ncbi:MAG: response regulator, partial [Calditrichaeota bacterium]|nr:response regulator [Calditrichota bacterium]
MSTKLINVLVVDDHNQVTTILKKTISENDSSELKILGAGWLGDALALLNENSFDVILLDLDLPDSSGIDTFHRIYSEVPEIPIIIISGTADEELAFEIVNEGAQDFLPKGEFDKSRLIQSIKFAIARHPIKRKLNLQSEILAASENRLQTIINTNADGLIVVDLHGDIRFANPSAELIFGRTFKELIGSNF